MLGQPHFISYSAVDAEAFALKLADDLQAGPPSFPVWIFRRDLRASARDWDTQIRDAIRDCDSLIFVMSRDSVTDESNCKPEWTAALKFKKPILLVRYDADAEAPFRLASRQYVDFSRDYNVGLARLRKDLQWLHSPQGELQTLKYRLADAKRDYARASDDERPRILADIEQLQKEIAERERALADPDAAARETELRIHAGIEREREPSERVKTTTKFINPPPFTAPPYFQDRHIENRHIANFLRDDSKRLLTINGRSGIGKTAMICRILKSLESGILPDDLGALTVDGIVYLSALGTRPINLPNLFADLCKLLPADTARQLDALYRDPKVSTRQKVLALLEQFPHGRILVLLDNFETVMDVSTCCLTDAELDDALRTLLDAPHHAVKVILTTRIPPRDLQLYHPERQAYLPVDQGLAPEYAKQLLRELDADGRVGLKNADVGAKDFSPLARAVERTRGFPRALLALYGILSADRYTTLEEILAAPLPENVVEALVGEAFARLDALAQRVMQALAAYNRPVPPAAVDYLLQPFLPNINSAPVLQRLVNMQFAHRESGKFYLHPADREYAWGQVKSEKAKGKSREDAWAPKNLLSRAADYFRATQLPRERWKTLDDLAPQLAEFDLRCAAEDYDTAADVLTDIDFDYLLLWGHYRLTIDLHKKLQNKLTDPIQFRNHERMQGQAYLAIGQVRKAIECFERALANARQHQARQGEASSLSDLGLAYADLGETRRAIEYYEQALAIAREIGDRRGEGADLGSLGLAYAALGETRRAIEYYEQALAIDREIGDRRGEETDLGNLGLAYAALGETRRAIAYYEQALTIAREIGDRRGEGNHLGNLGNAYADLGETRRAIAYYEQALAIDREIGDRRREGAGLGNLGGAYAALGETRRAIAYYEQALAIAREIGDRRAEGALLGNLGNAYAALGETRRAIELYEQALTIAREIGDRRAEGALLGNLGNAYAALGETRRAIEYYEQALAIAREIGDRRGEGADLGSLGLAYADLGETRRAIAYYEQALAIAREIGDRRGEETDLGNLGGAYAALGETRRAIAYYEQALAIAREIGDRRGEGNRLGNLAEALIALNRFDEAIERAQQSVKIAEEIAAPDLCSYHLATLALAHLYAAQEQQDLSGLAAARAAAERACQYDVPENNHNAFALLGIIALAQHHAGRGEAFVRARSDGEPITSGVVGSPVHQDLTNASPVQVARTAFTTAIAHADALLARTPELYGALDAKGIALCGLVLVGAHSGAPVQMQDAVEAFRAARQINADAGIVARVVRLLDALARTHPNGAALLAEARRVLEAVVSG